MNEKQRQSCYNCHFEKGCPIQQDSRDACPSWHKKIRTDNCCLVSDDIKYLIWFISIVILTWCSYFVLNVLIRR